MSVHKAEDAVGCALGALWGDLNTSRYLFRVANIVRMGVDGGKYCGRGTVTTIMTTSAGPHEVRVNVDHERCEQQRSSANFEVILIVSSTNYHAASPYETNSNPEEIESSTR